MSYWTIKQEKKENDECGFMVFIDDNNNEFETVINIPKKYHNDLIKGVKVKEIEQSTIDFLSEFYSIETAISVVAAFRFKDKDDLIDAKFLLSPSIQEAKKHLEFIDDTDIKMLLKSVRISSSAFARKILVPERTMRDRLNESKSSKLSFSEKYLAYLIFLVNNLNKKEK
jgi:hypothetical protein